jgi:SAM-dependent methyltransferase
MRDARRSDALLRGSRVNAPPNDRASDGIREIQRKVRAMLDERLASTGVDAIGQPSRYWSDVCSFFDYMLDLAPQAFAKLRLHTYHLTGDNYQTYLFGSLGPFLDYWGPWLDTEGLPPSHVLSEPNDGIGFRLDDGRFISQDVARFQRTVSTLSRQDVLGALERRGEPSRVLEIGAGYGGLVLHLSRILPTCCYVIIDLPETLIYSAAYLSLHAPEKRLWLYEPGSKLTREEWAEFDFVLLPNYRLDDLDGVEFDLAINVASMQEMRVDQAKRYLDFLAASLRGVFYSCNRDRQVSSNEMPGLFAVIGEQFEMTEVSAPSGQFSSWKARASRRLRRSLRRAARMLGLLEQGAGPAVEPFPFVEHLCVPRRDSSALP